MKDVFFFLFFIFLRKCVFEFSKKVRFSGNFKASSSNSVVFDFAKISLDVIDLFTSRFAAMQAFNVMNLFNKKSTKFWTNFSDTLGFDACDFFSSLVRGTISSLFETSLIKDRISEVIESNASFILFCFILCASDIQSRAVYCKAHWLSIIQRLQREVYRI